MRGDIRPEAFLPSSELSTHHLYFRAIVHHHHHHQDEEEEWERGGGRGETGGVGRSKVRRLMRRGFMQHLLLCWFHPWLQTPVVLALPHTSTLGGGRAEVGQASMSSVPGLGGDQRFTNDVYAVVLVDICWQNRSPVRHLEWN